MTSGDAPSVGLLESASCGAMGISTSGTNTAHPCLDQTYVTKNGVSQERANVHQTSTQPRHASEPLTGQKDTYVANGHGEGESEYKLSQEKSEGISSCQGPAQELRELLDDRIYPIEDDIIRLHVKLDDLRVVVNEIRGAVKSWDSKIEPDIKNPPAAVPDGINRTGNHSTNGSSSAFDSVPVSSKTESSQPMSVSSLSTNSSSPSLVPNNDSVSIMTITSAIRELATTLQGQQARWDLDEVGFFSPGDEQPLSYINNTVIYSDVFHFVDRIRDYATLKGDKLVAGNLFLCLRGDALLWYGHLSGAKKAILHQSLSTWCAELISRFKMPGVVALQKLCNDKFTVDDVRSGRNISDYLYSIVRYARSAGFDQVSDQIDFAYRGLDPILREYLAPPSADTSIVRFESQLRARLRLWIEEFGQSKSIERIIIHADPTLAAHL
ncbi:hypothetical protein L228DRAFT_260751 [Xylona heveae TC161]|uniref:Uncharacterized protein n=1 Tax=Xylona heveae (strain CBS 132557 / TC161) TaxID=1328760 RepID=A0A165GTK1_XYLHT|nr:hypothetical protein L228DRAFT_260751 [Xylona heveae TC161]KZF22581.1 hypothetical protein L228DRAFT_260751 [Xylona heveae TC161]